MMHTNKVVKIAVIGAVGVLALGACSSGANQSQGSESPDSPAASREAAPAPKKTLKGSKDGVPEGLIAMPKIVQSGYKGVSLSHNADAKCSQDQSFSGRIVYNCSNVKWNVFGDAVYVYLPNHNYNIEIENVGSGSSSMRSTQRNYAYVALNTKNEPHDRIIKWESPKNWSTDMGWGAGIESYYHYDGDAVSVQISIFLN